MIRLFALLALLLAVPAAAQLEAERRDLLRAAGADPSGEACVWLMVQRLAPEKATMVLLDALATMRAQGEGRPLEVDGRPLYLVIAGNPST